MLLIFRGAFLKLFTWH